MNRKLIISSFLISMLAVVIVIPACAQANLSYGYTGNSADGVRIEASAVRGATAQAEFTVFNIGSTDLNLEVWVDDDHSWWITFDQPSFTLKSGQNAKVKMNIDAPYNGSDQNDFRVYLKGTSAETSGIPLAQGYYISSSVALSGETTPSGKEGDPGSISWEWIVLALAVIAGVAGSIIYWVKLKGGAEK